MPLAFAAATPVALPAQSDVTAAYQVVHLADAFAIGLPPGTSLDPEVLARFVVANQPSWVGWLMRVRDLIVARFGLKTAAQLAADVHAGRIGIFRIYSVNETEIVVGENDRHLDFRASFLVAPAIAPASGAQLTASTVVHCHNLLGRTYIFMIAPFHRLIVKASLRRAAALGWPQAAESARA